MNCQRSNGVLHDIDRDLVASNVQRTFRFPALSFSPHPLAISLALHPPIRHTISLSNGSLTTEYQLANFFSLKILRLKTFRLKILRTSSQSAPLILNDLPLPRIA